MHKELTERRVFYRKMLSIALPVVGQGLLNNSLSFVDTLMIGQMGEASIAAVALANQVFFLISLFYFGLCSAAAIFLAQFWGARNTKNIQKIIGISTLLAGIASLVMSAASLFAPAQIMRIFTDDPMVIARGVEYQKIVAISYFFSAISQILATALRVTGHAKTPLKVALVALSFNAVGNYLLIFGIGPFPALGVAGAAIATTLARLLEIVVLLIVVYRHHPVLAIRSTAAFRFSRSFLAHIAPTSIPVITNEMLWSLGMVCYKIAYARMGVAAIAALNVTESIGNLFFVALMGVSNAALILIGIKIGEGDAEAAHSYARRLIFNGLAVGAAMGIFEALFAPTFAGFFNISATVRSLAITCLYIHAMLMPIRAVNIVIIVGILRAGGDTRFSMFAELFGVWGIGVPLAFFGAIVLQLTVTQLYLLLGLEELTKMCIGIYRIRSKKWVNDLTAFH